MRLLFKLSRALVLIGVALHLPAQSGDDAHITLKKYKPLAEFVLEDHDG